MLTFMLYRLVGLMPGLWGRGVGSGGMPSLSPFGCTVVASPPDVDVAGVVDVDEDPRAAEFNVEDDLRRDTPLPLVAFAWPLRCA